MPNKIFCEKERDSKKNAGGDELKGEPYSLEDALSPFSFAYQRFVLSM